MPGIPIALCGTNLVHFDYLVEHLKPEFEGINPCSVSWWHSPCLPWSPSLVSLGSNAKPPILAVVAIFTTPEAAANDLPMLLSRDRNPKTHVDHKSDTDSEESASISIATSLPKQPFALLLDPTALDPGTIPLSPWIFNVSARVPQAIAAVVVGAGFNQDWERIMDCCEEVGDRITWFRTGVEMSKKLDLQGGIKNEDLGKRVRRALDEWVKEESVDRQGKGTVGVRCF